MCIVTGKTCIYCPRDWRLPVCWEPNWGPPLNLSISLRGDGLKGFRGALDWSPMMPRDSSLSDSCSLISVVFPVGCIYIFLGGPGIMDVEFIDSILCLRIIFNILLMNHFPSNNFKAIYHLYEIIIEVKCSSKQLKNCFFFYLCIRNEHFILYLLKGVMISVQL